MRGFDDATILSPSFHSLRKERLAQWPAFCVLIYDQKFGEFFPKNWEGCAARFLKPLPYFRPKSVIFPTLFQTWRKPRASEKLGNGSGAGKSPRAV